MQELCRHELGWLSALAELKCGEANYSPGLFVIYAYCCPSQLLGFDNLFHGFIDAFRLIPSSSSIACLLSGARYLLFVDLVVLED